VCVENLHSTKPPNIVKERLMRLGMNILAVRPVFYPQVLAPPAYGDVSCREEASIIDLTDRNDECNGFSPSGNSRVD
jgi:hypothetical protein